MYCQTVLKAPLQQGNSRPQTGLAQCPGQGPLASRTWDNGGWEADLGCWEPRQQGKLRAGMPQMRFAHL